MSVIDSGRQRVQQYRDGVDWRHTAEVGVSMYLGMALSAAVFLALGGSAFINPEATWRASEVLDLSRLGGAIAGGAVFSLIGLPFAAVSARFANDRWTVRGWDLGPAIAGVASILGLVSLFVVIFIGSDGFGSETAFATFFLVEVPLVVLYLCLTFGGIFIPVVTGATLGHRVATDGFEPRRLAVIAAIGVVLTLAAGVLSGYWDPVFEVIAKFARLS